MCAARCLEVMLVAIVDQRRHRGIRLEHDVSAMPAVAAVRPAFGNVRFTAEAHATGTAVAAFYVNMNFISEHIDPFSFGDSEQLYEMGRPERSNDIETMQFRAKLRQPTRHT